MLEGTPVKVYNADSNCFDFAVVRAKGDCYCVDRTDAFTSSTEIFLTPGWIDLHTHINDGFGMFGIKADDIGYKTGVCLLADAGTTGDYTIGGFRKYVEPTIKTNIRLFICISPIGIIFNHEYNVLEYLNIENTVKTIEANRDIICGVKVRMASGVIRHEGMEPLRIASRVARSTNLPLMVHVGGNPPYLRDIEPYLKKGDILTHCFNGAGDLWNDDGTPSESLKILIERGVVLDVGHGAGSFSFEVCKKALALEQDIGPICISTDLHALSRNNLVYDMATTLSKMLSAAMPLTDIIYGVTKLPADILRLEGWCDLSSIRNATAFRIEDLPAVYTDCYGKAVSFNRRIVPVGVVLNGVFYEL